MIAGLAAPFRKQLASTLTYLRTNSGNSVRHNLISPLNQLKIGSDFVVDEKSITSYWLRTSNTACVHSHKRYVIDGDFERGQERKKDRKGSRKERMRDLLNREREREGGGVEQDCPISQSTKFWIHENLDMESACVHNRPLMKSIQYFHKSMYHTDWAWFRPWLYVYWSRVPSTLPK